MKSSVDRRGFFIKANKKLRKTIFLYVLLGLGWNMLPAQFSLYLIGDAGKYATLEENPALQSLRTELISEDDNSAVIYLGDNIYHAGLEKGKNYAENKGKIEAQMGILSAFKGYAFFVPGNHDWQVGKEGGLEVLCHQKAYVDSFIQAETRVKNKETGTFYPRNCGLPGPDTFRVSDNVLMLMFDSQWFNHKRLGKTVGTFSGKDLDQTETLFWETLMDILKESRERGDFVVMAAHHPVFSIGPHGHRSQGQDVFNSIGRYNTQELYGKGYRRFRDRMSKVMSAFPETVIYVAGHDHNLQYWKAKGGNHHIISGAGSKNSGYYPKVEQKPWNQGAELAFPDANRYPELAEGKSISEKEVNLGFFRLEFDSQGDFEIFVHEIGKEPLKIR